MVRGIGVLHGQGDIRIRVIGIPVVVFINEGRPLGIAVDANRFAAGLAIFFLIGAADADAVGMVRNDNDKCIIIVLFGVVLRPFDGLIKFDGVIGGTLPVHGMELLINAAAFTHEKEAIRIFFKYGYGFFCHIKEARLVSKPFQDLAVFGQEFTVHVNVHVVHGEKPQNGLIAVESI